jgi:hypothetical protein
MGRFSLNPRTVARGSLCGTLLEKDYTVAC